MKLLIVTAWYAPFVHPRAQRWTALAEHWVKEGHEVHVLTARLRERPASKETTEGGVFVHRAGFDSLKEWAYFLFGTRGARGRAGLKPEMPGMLARIGIWCYKTIWKNLFFPDDACLWYVPARKKILQLFEREHFDAVITVSLPFTGHLLGLHILRKASSFGKPKPVWLADIGDPFCFQAMPPNNRFLYQKTNRRLERQVLEAADLVTVTNEATRQLYRRQFGERAVAKMFVLPPLLTAYPPPVTAHRSAVAHRDSPITKIGYFGALYAPTRTPGAFLDMLAQTFESRPDLRERLEIHFYGEIFPEFFKQLSAVPEIRLHGLCARQEVCLAMQEMDMLLNIGNTTDFQLPSKAADYLASGKPVLNLSYVERDPFVEFFKGNPLIFNIKIENGRLENEGVRRWVEWLESEKPVCSEAEVAGRIAPYRLETIAGRYLKLLASVGGGAG